ncbi:MAG TPA: PhzF family phenazine biosynthesis protein [Gemmatimonadales bacterium]
MPVRLTTVDAFTAAPFAGNPAAVCLLAAPRDDAWMQAVAREMNLAETAFLLRQGNEFGLRWFTPAVEIDLCGHATLASAHVLWEDGHLARDAEARFHTRSGLLRATRQDDWITLDFPATPPVPCDPVPDIVQAIGAPIRLHARSRFDYLVELESEAAVRALTPDLALLARLGGTRGVIVTSRAASPGIDFVSRFFAPAAGIPEDPVTGSAHCALGPLWGERLGKTSLVGYQASARGGIVRVTLAGDRVLLGGQAVTVLRAELVA